MQWSCCNLIPEPRPPLAPWLARRVWIRLANVWNHYQHIIRAAVLATLLAFFLAVLPADLQTVVWRVLSTRGPMAVMLFLFNLVALSLLWAGGEKIDAWAFLAFNLRGKRPAWLDGLMLALTQLGSGPALILLAGGMLLAGMRLAAYDLLLNAILLWLVVELAKSIIRRPRPFVKLTQTRIVGYRASGRSFPSGHTSQAFFLATMLAEQMKLEPLAAVLLYITAGLVGITRMYVGAHYPRDVLAGAMLGTVWGLLGMLVAKTL
jgi:membrane-associated phospholipid phosphatase